METSDSSHFIDGLFYEGRLPIRWQVLSRLPDTLELEKYAYQNCQVLQVQLSLEGGAHEVEDEPETVTHELERLDSKINLLLGMVGQLMGRLNDLPPMASVCLGAEAMTLGLPTETARALCSSSPVLARMEIFLNLQFPVPLTLVVELKIVQEDHGTALIRGDYQGQDSKQLDLLEKFIFRQHRRQIARSRQHE